MEDSVNRHSVECSGTLPDAASQVCFETPLLDRLRGVPLDARGQYDHNETCTSHFAYGRLCAAAVKRIMNLEFDLKVAQDAVGKDNTRAMNLELDIERVMNRELPINSFEIVHRLAKMLWTELAAPVDATERSTE